MTTRDLLAEWKEEAARWGVDASPYGDDVAALREAVLDVARVSMVKGFEA